MTLENVDYGSPVTITPGDAKSVSDFHVERRRIDEDRLEGKLQVAQGVCGERLR